MERSHIRQFSFLLLQVTAGAGLLWWMFRRPGLAEDFVAALRQVDVWWLLAALVAAWISIMAHVCRWWLCLRVLGLPTGWRHLHNVFLASSFLGIFTIGGLGADAARDVLLARDHPGNTSRLTVSVIADRLCGLISLLVPVLLFTLPMQDRLSGTLMGRGAFHFLGGYMVFSLALLVFAFFSGSDFARNKLPSWLPARDWLYSASEALQALRPDPAGLFAAVVVSTVMLAFHFLTFWCVARGAGAAVPLADLFAALPVVEAATTVPITPSGIGVREEVMMDQLRALSGTSAGVATLISMAAFLCGQFWYLLGGLLAVPLFSKKPAP